MWPNFLLGLMGPALRPGVRAPQALAWVLGGNGSPTHRELAPRAWSEAFPPRCPGLNSAPHTGCGHQCGQGPQVWTVVSVWNVPHPHGLSPSGCELCPSSVNPASLAWTEAPQLCQLPLHVAPARARPRTAGMGPGLPGKKHGQRAVDTGPQARTLHSRA